MSDSHLNTAREDLEKLREFFGPSDIGTPIHYTISVLASLISHAESRDELMGRLVLALAGNNLVLGNGKDVQRFGYELLAIQRELEGKR